jgi:Serine endopeptidase inhibitors
VKESSIKFSLSTLALLGLASVAANPALADAVRISENSDLQPTSKIQTSELKGNDLPFFARFLEGQKPEATDRKVALTGGGILIKPKHPGNTGGIITTKKYPSDAEDNSGGGVMTTQKYPSDSEDSSGGGIITTNKYPSDAEDNSGGGMMTTKKYPSDAEDNSGGFGHPRRRH